jgi:hypothetical protein
LRAVPRAVDVLRVVFLRWAMALACSDGRLNDSVVSIVSLEEGKLGAIAVAAVGASRQRLVSGKTLRHRRLDAPRLFPARGHRERFAAAESAERFAAPGGKRNAPDHARIGHPQAKEQG